MNRDRPRASSYVVYVRHESASAASGFHETTASPIALSSLLRNRTLLFTTPEAVPADGVPDDSDEV